jgi:hypothetical protein
VLAFSVDRAVADGFARPGGTLLEHYLAGQGHRHEGEGIGAASIDQLSQLLGQREVLFPALSLVELVGPQRPAGGGIQAAITQDVLVWAAAGESRTLEEMWADDRAVA